MRYFQNSAMLSPVCSLSFSHLFLFNLLSDPPFWEGDGQKGGDEVRPR
jgi:hypothetical protein